MRRLAAVTGGAVLVAAAGFYLGTNGSDNGSQEQVQDGAAQAAQSSPLALIPTTPCQSNRVCVRWLPIVADGFVFFRDSNRQSNTWDGSRTQVVFGKLSGRHVYTVVPITRDFEGSLTVPPVLPPPTTTAPTTTTSPTTTQGTTTTPTTTVGTTTTEPPIPPGVRPWGTANSPTVSAANVWIAPLSGDDATCSRSASPRAPVFPCRSFQGAYDVAALGDTVGMQDGNYGAQFLRDSPGKTDTAPSADVTFTPQHINAVTVRSLDFGDIRRDNGADHITINGIASDEVGQVLTHPCEFSISTASYDVTLAYVHTCRMYVQGAVDLTTLDSELGPCVVHPNGFCGSTFTDSYSGTPHTKNVVWDNDTFHDYSIGADDPGAHLQCMFALTAVTVRNSRFFHCAIFNIFFQANDGTKVNPFDGTLLEGNWFAATRVGALQDECCSNTALALPPASQHGNLMHVTDNRFMDSQAYWGTNPATNSTSTGNIFRTSDGNTVNCATSANTGNVYVGANAKTCGGAGETTRATWPYVVPSNDADMDYRLTS